MKLAVLFLLSGAVTLWGQRVTGTLTASIRGGGGEGKCTIEAFVDDVAEVEVRGRTATIRTLSGAPASLRRFECNQEMPRDPSGFRFKGIDGRGRQDLVRDPSNGESAVVRLEDTKGGAEGYTFDLIWRGSGDGYESGGRYDRDRSSGGRFDGGRLDSGRLDGVRPGGWDNGWGRGSGWNNNDTFNYNSGRRGGGEFRDRNGNRIRLDAARVVITNSGSMEIFFDSDQGRLTFAGRVDDRDGRRLSGQVRGSGVASGARGRIEIEMSSFNEVRSIILPDINLRWANQ